jgi:hypothetical protein
MFLVRAPGAAIEGNYKVRIEICLWIYLNLLNERHVQDLIRYIVSLNERLIRNKCNTRAR